MGTHQKKREHRGLRVDVRNNNVEFALKKFKRIVKESELMVALKEKSYYKKPSAKKREKKNMQSLRYKYQSMKEDNNY